MKNIKYEFNLFTFFDKVGIENHLNKMAKNGWALDKIGEYIWKYRKCDEEHLTYEVTYIPDDTAFSYENSEEELTFKEFCSRAGWEEAARWYQMRVFVNHRENPVAIETDPVIEVENIHKTMQKNQLMPYIAILLLFLPLGFFLLMSTTNLLALLSSNYMLFIACFIIFTGAVIIVPAVSYSRWYDKASVKAEEEGVFLERSQGYRMFNIAAVLGSIIMAAVLIRTGGLGTAIYFFGYLLVISFGRRIISVMKKVEGWSKAKLAVLFMVMFILVGGLSSISDKFDNKGKLVSEKSNPNISETVFLKETVGEKDNMNYAFVEVKLNILNKMLRDEMLEIQYEWGTYDYNYEKIEADEWEAEEVYQAKAADGGYLTVVLWKDEFLKIRTDEIPDEEVIEMLKDEFRK